MRSRRRLKRRNPWYRRKTGASPAESGSYWSPGAKTLWTTIIGTTPRPEVEKETIFCMHPGCEESTRGGKPFCSEHIEEGDFPSYKRVQNYMIELDRIREGQSSALVLEHLEGQSSIAIEEILRALKHTPIRLRGSTQGELEIPSITTLLQLDALPAVDLLVELKKYGLISLAIVYRPPQAFLYASLPGDPRLPRSRDIEVEDEEMEQIQMERILTEPTGILEILGTPQRKPGLYSGLLYKERPSKARYKERIEDIIFAEDKTKPLSDAKIAARLNVSGPLIHKYREELGIPNSLSRRSKEMERLKGMQKKPRSRWCGRCKSRTHDFIDCSSTRGGLDSDIGPRRPSDARRIRRYRRHNPRGHHSSNRCLTCGVSGEEHLFRNSDQCMRCYSRERTYNRDNECDTCPAKGEEIAFNTKNKCMHCHNQERIHHSDNKCATCSAEGKEIAFNTKNQCMQCHNQERSHHSDNKCATCSAEGKEIAFATKNQCKRCSYRKHSQAITGRFCISCGWTDEEYAEVGSSYGQGKKYCTRCSYWRKRHKKKGWPVMCVSGQHLLPPPRTEFSETTRIQMQPRDFPACDCYIDDEGVIVPDPEIRRIPMKDEADPSRGYIPLRARLRLAEERSDPGESRERSQIPGHGPSEEFGPEGGESRRSSTRGGLDSDIGPRRPSDARRYRRNRRRYRRNPAKCPDCGDIKPDSEIGEKCFWCNYRKELPAPILMEQYDFTPLPMYEAPEACDCEVCRSMCKRPCWPTPQDAERLMDLGYGDRLMIDYWGADESLDHTELLVPAFHGLEKDYAPTSMVTLDRYEREAGCNFLTAGGLCEIHSICKPTEGRLASCKGTPRELHLQVAQTWDTPEAKALVERWKREMRAGPRRLRRNPENYLYHVTLTKYVPSIKERGLLQMFKPSNWVKGPKRSRYNKDAGIFAFEDPKDALRWAIKMEWALGMEKRKPKPDLSIVRIDMEDFWEEDPAPEFKIFKNFISAKLSKQNIRAEKIIDSFTMKSFGTPIEFDMNLDEWLEKVSGTLRRA